MNGRRLLKALLCGVVAWCGVAAQAPEPRIVPPSPDPIADAAAKNLSDADLSLFIAGYYKLAEAQVNQVQAQLPAGRYAMYERNGAGGRPVIEFDTGKLRELQKQPADVPGELQVDLFGAYFEAVADTGDAGALWKRRYDAAVDKPTFGHGIARAFLAYNRRQAEKSRSDIAWIHTAISIGSTRDQIAGLLKSRGWQFDGASVFFPTGFNLACGDNAIVTFIFDAHDRLSSIEDSSHTTCL